MDCCGLSEGGLEAGACEWVEFEPESAFALGLPEGHVIRGVRSTFHLPSMFAHFSHVNRCLIRDNLFRDRGMGFEVCPLLGFAPANRCSAQLLALDERDKSLVRFPFPRSA